MARWAASADPERGTNMDNSDAANHASSFTNRIIAPDCFLKIVAKR